MILSFPMNSAPVKQQFSLSWIVRALKKKSREACLGASLLIGVADFGERMSGGSGVWTVSECFWSLFRVDFFDLAEAMGDSLVVWIIPLPVDVCGDLGTLVGGDSIFKVKCNGGVLRVDDGDCGML